MCHNSITHFELFNEIFYLTNLFSKKIKKLEKGFSNMYHEFNVDNFKAGILN